VTRNKFSPKMLETLKKDASSQASSVARQLAFAGLAVIWILKPGGESTGISALATVPYLLRSFIALILALAFDFMQYAWLAVGWWVAVQFKSQRIQKYVGFPSTLLFYMKLIFVLVGFGKLGIFIWRSI
jgi:hypothetical protein